MKDPETLAEVLKRLGVKMTTEKRKLMTTDERARWAQKPLANGKRELVHAAWTVELSFEGRTYASTYFQNKEQKTVKSDEYVSCLVSDARCGEESFLDYCNSMDANPDSRANFALWETCVKTRQDMITFFGYSYFHEVCNAEQP